jgi:hypothetical protein
MQTGFDFTGMREQLGDGYDAFVREWAAMQATLAGRGKAMPKAGRILSSMVSSYGIQFVKKCCQNAKAPSWTRAQILMEIYEWLGDFEMSDEQAAVLDSVIGRRLGRELRLKVLQWMKEGMSAQDIEDLLESLPPGPDKQPVPHAPTEDEIRQWFAEQLKNEGWDVRLEQPTKDNGAVDIVATRDGELRIVECKVDLDRKTAYYAIGQLSVYARTFKTKDWWIAYWRMDETAAPIIKECRGLFQIQKVSKTGVCEAAS